MVYESRLEKSSKLVFSFVFYGQNFKLSHACLGASYDVLGLGFDSVMIMEWNWLAL